jgi:hypothetical protein
MVDLQNQVKLEAGSGVTYAEWFDNELQPGERILGIKAALFDDEQNCFLRDPIFIIGHLE